MKILLVSTPIRPVPTMFPPFGSMALMKHLRKNGYEDVHFYDIDCLRPTFEEAVDRIIDTKPDVLGISAVVSTAYEYTKRLSLAVKERLPDTVIVVGGNLAASAEVLLKRTGTDLCVIGEGETVFLNLVRRAETTKTLAEYWDIPGLVFLGADDQIVNTGYETQLPGDEIYDIDWDDLREGSNLDYFFPVAADSAVITDEMYNGDERAKALIEERKTFGYLYTSKGCVNRCTFCHRWDKGLRVIPVDTVLKRLDEMIEKFNVGFLKIADENFGADHRWLAEFCEKIKPYGILWNCGTRVKGMTEDVIRMMKDAGCARLGFGIETGSEKMLAVMEKKVTLEENYAAFEISQRLKIDSPIALVIGMPGENRETIQDTVRYCEHFKTARPDLNPNDLSINYAQALPGTSLYEYARSRGMIGADLDGEEKYLLDISDKDAHDEVSTLNFTEEPSLICQTWRPLITISTNYAFVKKFGLDLYLENLLSDANFFEKPAVEVGYNANPRRLIETHMSLEADRDQTLHASPKLRRPPLLELARTGQFGRALICYPVLAYRLRRLLPLMVLYKGYRKFGRVYASGLLKEFVVSKFRKSSRLHKGFSYKSLRRTVDRDIGPLSIDRPALAPLRRGR